LSGAYVRSLGVMWVICLCLGVFCFSIRVVFILELIDDAVRFISCRQGILVLSFVVSSIMIVVENVLCLTSLGSALSSYFRSFPRRVLQGL
jgi:hypothetical protein